PSITRTWRRGSTDIPQMDGAHPRLRTRRPPSRPRRQGVSALWARESTVVTPRPGYKCHPHADPGTTRRMIEVLRFVVGLAADVVRRRAGSRRRERPASAAAHRRAAKNCGAGPVGTMAALHDGARSTHGAGVARRHGARPAGDNPPLAPGRLSRVLAPPLSAVGSTPYPARRATSGVRSKPGTPPWRLCRRYSSATVTRSSALASPAFWHRQGRVSCGLHPRHRT